MTESRLNLRTRSCARTLPPEACAPFERHSGDGQAGALVLCDHASNAVPRGYGTLGLEPTDFNNHIAYDIGAAMTARRLAAALDCPAVLAGFSRLFIDPNRGLDDPTLVMQLSGGRPVPANRHLDAEALRERVEGWYEPYHQAIEAEINRLTVGERVPALVSVHSFTPIWKNNHRPWHAGILWDRDDRLARPLIQGLRSLPSLHIGDNQPYSGQLQGDCMSRHGAMRGVAHVLVELRQDLIATPAGQAVWADRLAGFLRPLLARPEIHVIRYYGS